MKLPLLLKNLKNLCLCRIHKFNNKLVYPNSILPKSNYKNLLVFDDIINQQELFLVRRTELSFHETYFKLGNRYYLKDDAIENKRIPNLSTNLLGAFFKPEYSFFRINMKEPASNKWNGSQVFLHEHLDSYSKVNGGCLIYLNVNNIHLAKFPYNLNSNKDYHSEVKKMEKVFENNIIKNDDGEEIILNGSSEIIHDPINLNYWHVEVKIKDFSNEILKNADTNKRKQIAESAFENLIKVNSFSSVQEVVKIPSKFYKKN